MLEDLFFDSWETPIRILLTGLFTYIFLVLSLRVSGKRTLSKWNSFDFVVTIALGSTFASIVTSKTLTILDGVVAITFLIGIQFIITWVSVRFRPLEKLVKGSPRLLFHKGGYLLDAMKKARVHQTEVDAAIRTAGMADKNLIEAVVLETDGTFSVISKEKAGSGLLLKPLLNR